MAYDPGFDTDVEQLTPEEAHDVWEAKTNLDAKEMRDLRDSPEHEAYLEQASDQRQTEDPPIEGGPLDDAIHLATTPADEWGADEKAEAEEALDYGARASAQYDPAEGDDLVDGPPKTTKADVAGARWGFDWKPEDDWP